METAPGKANFIDLGFILPNPCCCTHEKLPPEGHRGQLLISGGSPSLLPQVAQPCSSFLGALCGFYPASGARPAAGMCPARMAREITTTTTAHSWGQESGKKKTPHLAFCLPLNRSVSRSKRKFGFKSRSLLGTGWESRRFPGFPLGFRVLLHKEVEKGEENEE